MLTANLYSLTLFINKYTGYNCLTRCLSLFTKAALAALGWVGTGSSSLRLVPDGLEKSVGTASGSNTLRFWGTHPSSARSCGVVSKLCSVKCTEQTTVLPDGPDHLSLVLLTCPAQASLKDSFRGNLYRLTPSLFDREHPATQQRFTMMDVTPKHTKKTRVHREIRYH